MAILKILERYLTVLLLVVGLNLSFGFSPASAVLIYTEAGFEFSLSDSGEGYTPYFIGSDPFLGSSSILAICPACYDDMSNILSIVRTDGLPFSMTGFTATTFDSLVDFVVTDSAFAILDAGTLGPGGPFVPFAISTPSLLELLVFSPEPLGDPESIDCLCFDSMTFDAGFDAPVVVTFPGAVPLPAAVWLFGTALIGVFGFSRRRTATFV